VSLLLLIGNNVFRCANNMSTIRYYTFLITASALSTLSSPYIIAVPSPSNLPNVAIYAVYPSAPSNTSKPTKLIILNLSFHAASSAVARREAQISVSGVLDTSNVKVTRFTAPGADSETQATFGGQDWLSSGTGVPVGKKVVETVGNGVVSVGDSEGLLLRVEGGYYGGICGPLLG
jgi:hypothetical protein